MLLAIAFGGAVGSVLRYLLGTFVGARLTGFPWGTLLINVTGSLLLGFLSRFLVGRSVSPAIAAALTVGFCGGFTTFSAFSVETVALIERGAWVRALLYAVTSVALCVGGAATGMAMARATGASAPSPTSPARTTSNGARGA